MKKFIFLGLICCSKFSFAQFTTGSGNISQVTVGNVGIGVTAPIAKLQVKNGSILFDGTTGVTPTSGSGTRLMWIPAKSAFRAGNIGTGGTYWDDINIGTFSFAVGANTIASSVSCFAVGSNTTASGPQSTALGTFTIASGENSTALGRTTTASGSYSTSLGIGTVAQAARSIVIGSYNLDPGTYSLTSFISTDPLFIIGNGTTEFTRSNAVTVLKNGNTGLGTALPIQKLDVTGRMNISNGVIQKGGTAITTTSDLGLYSRDANTYIRIVTTGQPIKFYADGGVNPIGDSQIMSMEPSKNVIVGINGNPLDDTKLFVETSTNSAGKVGIVSKSTYTTPWGYGVVSSFPTSQFKAFAAINHTTNEEVFQVRGDGSVYAKEIRVRLTPFPDYVFGKNYDLMPLDELEKFIFINNHLPNIPSSKEIDVHGIGVGELQMKQMEKIEELTLYVIELKKEIDNLKVENAKK